MISFNNINCIEVDNSHLFPHKKINPIFFVREDALAIIEGKTECFEAVGHAIIYY